MRRSADRFSKQAGWLNVQDGGHPLGMRFFHGRSKLMQTPKKQIKKTTLKEKVIPTKEGSVQALCHNT
jgi:hypothetical protein